MAFALCTNLETVISLSPDIRIEKNAFKGCPQINRILICANRIPDLKNIFPDSERLRITLTPSNECTRTPALEISVIETKKETYQNGKSGTTLLFKIKNTTARSFYINVEDVYIVNESQKYSRDYWLSPYTIKDQLIRNDEELIAGAVFTNETISSYKVRLFSDIGISMKIYHKIDGKRKAFSHNVDILYSSFFTPSRSGWNNIASYLLTQHDIENNQYYVNEAEQSI